MDKSPNSNISQASHPRYLQLTGKPFEIGVNLGQSLKDTLAADINHYLENGPLKFGDLTRSAIDSGAMGWFGSLPERFQQEMQGMADGSGVPLKEIAAWGYADAGGRKACSGFLLRSGESLWVGRNNDLWAPDLWGYAIERHITGRLATLAFGMRGEIFAATGLNEAGLWLHYNWLPAYGRPDSEAWTPYVLLTEILETCQTIDEVEAILNQRQRTGGMLIYAADVTGQAALLECAPRSFQRSDLDGPFSEKSFLAGTNHYQQLVTPQPAADYAAGSVKRLQVMEDRLSALAESPQSQDLIAILADPEVEQHQPDYGTVYSNLVNLTKKACWFTFGGFPAASRGNWEKLAWPF